MRKRTLACITVTGALLLGSVCFITASNGDSQLTAASTTSTKVHDPGVRGGAPGAGNAIAGLDPTTQSPAFTEGQTRFQDIESVVPNGLGPRFNAESCAQCHANPAVGGTSPLVNPQVADATHLGGKNVVPSFILPNGPVREVRFKKNPDGTADGGVHDLYVITGRSDLPQPNGCNIAQPDFVTALKQQNAIFRIPTPTFGLGLIESIPDATILANETDQLQAKAALGIHGHENHTAGVANRSGNDGTITRFGWKAQNKSLAIFAGEAYNVEEGVTNELFPNEREDTPSCVFNPLPEDQSDFSQASTIKGSSDVVMFSFFMRTLAPPVAVNQTDPQVVRGRQAFDQVGCAMCHTPTLRTGTSAIAALSNQDARLYSDLLVHHMGKNLNDGVSQGNAGPDEFRSAPLWGLGQRTFFLHDGRTNDLLEAIKAHASKGSEANQVIHKFDGLSPDEQQALLVFLRSL
jgi:CxxC motif-containing protein (DUF1111 family)